MFAYERQEEILTFLREHGKAEVTELVNLLGVTEMTVRRDLTILKDKNVIYRTHGGALYKEPQILWQFSTLHERLEKNIEEKNRIAQYVSKELVQNRDTLFMDAGSTTIAVAKYLAKEKLGLLLVTNSDAIGNTLLNEKHKVILTGGVMELGVNALTGPLTESVIRSFHVEKAIIGTSSIQPTEGLFSTNPFESEVKHLMIENSKSTIVVADSTKFDFSALNLFCKFPHDNLTIVTDSGIYSHKDAMQKLNNQGVRVVIV